MFIEEAKKYQVSPARRLGRRADRRGAPQHHRGPHRVSSTPSHMTGLPQGDSPMLLDSSYTITADIADAEGAGSHGVSLPADASLATGFICSRGSRCSSGTCSTWSGWNVEGHRCHPHWQAHCGVRLQVRRARLRQGRHRRALGRWQGTVAARRSTTRFHVLMAIDESFDIGSDTRTRRGRQTTSCRSGLTGKINKLTYRARAGAVDGTGPRGHEEGTRLGARLTM